MLASESSRALRVFLCHSSNDKPLIRNLYCRLIADNIDAWLDEENLLPGQDWNLEIEKAVRGADIVIVCLSNSSVSKAGYIQKEIKYALDVADEQPEGRIFIIPLRLEECEIPRRLQRWQWVNYFDERGYKNLMRALSVRASMPDPTIHSSEAVIYQETKIKTSILFLAADPTDASRLRLGEELREIQEKLQLSKFREQFELHHRMSIRPVDISQALLDVQPKIVHFSGHGKAGGALCFEDQTGETHPVQPDALAALFEQFANQVSCVLLNACYSEIQANALAKHIDYVVGMSQGIGDKAAIAFAIGFYQAVGAGRTIEESYKLGCVQIRLQGIPEHLTPILIKSRPATPESPSQSTSVPESPQTTDGKIVFDSPVDGKWQVFIVSPDGSGLEQLTNMADGIGDPAISPDGTLIVFVGDGGKRIYVMNADGTQINSVYETNTEAGWPAWSPDSKKIVFAVQVKGRKNLFLMNSDGTGLNQLTDILADDLAPSFSPDGNYVAFSSNRSRKWEIYRLTLISKEIIRLTDLGDLDGQGWPSWSPDGLSIAFESRGNANSRDIFMMNADGTQIRNLTDSPEYEGAPVWSPDGKRIAFASDRDGSLDIYLMQNDGTRIQRLTRIWAWGPSWSFR